MDSMCAVDENSTEADPLLRWQGFDPLLSAWIVAATLARLVGVILSMHQELQNSRTLHEGLTAANTLDSLEHDLNPLRRSEESSKHPSRLLRKIEDLPRRP